MNVLLRALLPELILTIVAVVLFLFGLSARASVRRLACALAIASLVVVWVLVWSLGGGPLADRWDTVRVSEFSRYITLLVPAVGVLLLLLAWPSDRDATGNSALNFGQDAGEFYGLALLSLTGVLLVAGANDIILLFLGIELASLPTYIMVSISRPLPVAQEAGVKYFFLGAMSAALMLFGFSYLYGTTGSLSLQEIQRLWSSGAGAAPVLGPWQLLAIVMIFAGLAFKMAAVPLHFYAADVYQGAATPVTAFLSFVPKTSGIVALIKILFMASGGAWVVDRPLVSLLWIVAVLTMSVGNVLGLLQFNVKRLLAYSSIAHSGYMLVGVTALVSTTDAGIQADALKAVLFYLAAYGVMNVGAFGVLMMLPARQAAPATSAETFEDLAGQGRQHPALGLAMAVCCFSLIGLPLTVGFVGKFYLIRPALNAQLYGLAIVTVLNAAVSAAYYLRIVGALFLRTEAAPAEGTAVAPLARSSALSLAVLLSAVLTFALGTVVPATRLLTHRAAAATEIEALPRSLAPTLSSSSHLTQVGQSGQEK